jgi:Fic family protein
MSRSDTDTKPAIPEAEDRGESLYLMEPLLIAGDSRHRPPLADLTLDVASRSAGFRRSLPDGVRAALVRIVRAMNCYYSNLIEGHDTHPVEIERALRNDYSRDAGKRNLQIEAKAHIAVQEWLDDGGLSGRATTVAGIQEIHRRFCELLPDELLWVENPDTAERVRVEPGRFRRWDTRVGRHVSVSPGAVPRFLARYESAYENLGRTDAILAAAAAHHRLVWIHPFLDGNGRVARLASHAILLDLLDTGGIWSVSRGLARNASAYKHHLALCDLPRRNDLDGRGNLSEEALADFTRFFLETCVDQVSFMEDLVQPERLRARILLWTEEEARLGRLPAKSAAILEAVLYRGELSRGDAAGIVGTGARQARRVVATLIDAGVLTSPTSRAPLRLVFPARLAPRWLPGLFPDRTG